MQATDKLCRLVAGGDLTSSISRGTSRGISRGRRRCYFVSVRVGGLHVVIEHRLPTRVNVLQKNKRKKKKGKGTEVFSDTKNRPRLCWHIMQSWQGSLALLWLCPPNSATATLIRRSAQLTLPCSARAPTQIVLAIAYTT